MHQQRSVQAGDLLFVSGCIPLVPSTMQIVQGGIVEQTEQALANLKSVVEASGSDIGRVAKTTVRAMPTSCLPIEDVTWFELCRSFGKTWATLSS